MPAAVFFASGERAPEGPDYGGGQLIYVYSICTLYVYSAA